ncbi:MAG: isocitrate lyase/PEP mutase family protein, partial [Acidimicrobiales bacterium]
MTQDSATPRTGVHAADTEGADLRSLASTLRSRHRPGDPLVLVNAWDVASAEHVVAAGGRAIGTSSAAMAASLGIPDSPDAPVDDIFEMIARIASTVDVPVTADLLDGYRLGADDLVARLVDAGAVGCNIEDSDHGRPGQLLEPEAAANRLSELRRAASSAGVDIFINARIDCLLYDRTATAPDGEATSDILTRARLYIEAGADCVYPIRLTDPELARSIVDGVGAPVNANWAPQLEMSRMAASGVHRISIGPTAHRVVLGALD